jgi:hypothetical protein
VSQDRSDLCHFAAWRMPGHGRPGWGPNWRRGHVADGYTHPLRQILPACDEPFDESLGKTSGSSLHGSGAARAGERKKLERLWCYTRHTWVFSLRSTPLAPAGGVIPKSCAILLRPSAQGAHPDAPVKPHGCHPRHRTGYDSWRCLAMGRDRRSPKNRKPKCDGYSGPFRTLAALSTVCPTHTPMRLMSGRRRESQRGSPCDGLRLEGKGPKAR